MAKKTATPVRQETIEDWLERQPKRRRAPEIFQKLQRLFRKPDRKSVKWWRQVGELVLRLLPSGENQPSGAQRLAESLPGEDVRAKKNWLWAARLLVSTFKGPELRALSRKLTVTNILRLTKVRDETKRKEFAERAIQERWSWIQLDQEIKEWQGGRRSAGGRRLKPKEIRSPALAIQDLRLATDRWLVAHKQCFAGKTAPLRKVPKAQRSKILLDEARRAVDLLPEVIKAAKEGLKEFRVLIKEPRSRSKGRARR